jgi:hypothetical protein
MYIKKLKDIMWIEGDNMNTQQYEPMASYEQEPTIAELFEDVLRRLDIIEEKINQIKV